MVETISNITYWVKKYRENANLSQQELAQKSGIIQSYISKLERGKINNLTIETLEKIFSVLGYRLRIKPSKLPARNRYSPSSIPCGIECFWDIDKRNLRLPEHLFFLVERILEYGGIKSVKWLFSYIRKEEIIGVLKKSKNLTRKTANFWTNCFGINRRSVLCLSKRFPKEREKIWRY